MPFDRKRLPYPYPEKEPNPERPPRICPRCRGSGKVIEKDADGKPVEKTCPSCGGAGTYR